MLLLLADSFQSVSVPLIQQRDGLVMTAAQVHTATSAPVGSTTSGHAGHHSSASNSKNAKSVKPTMFILILEVLSSLLEHSVGGKSANSGTNTAQLHGVQFSFNPTFPSNAALLLSHYDNSRGGMNIGNESSNSNNNSTQSNSGSKQQVTLSVSLMHDILSHMSTVWKNLVINNAAISIDLIGSLQALARVLLSVAQSISTQQLDFSARDGLWDAYFSIVMNLFSHFPHTCIEATLAVPDSFKERQGSQMIEQLDISLCEIAFTFISSLSSEHSESVAINTLREAATAYLLHRLRSYTTTVEEMEMMQSQADVLEVDASSSDGDAAESEEDEDDDEEVDNDSDVDSEEEDTGLKHSHKENKELAESKSRRGGTSDTASMSSRAVTATEVEKVATSKIFKSFELMMSRNTVSALYELLQLLEKLFQALALVSQQDRRSVTYMMNPATECLCSIISRIHQEMSDDYTEDLYVVLMGAVSAALELTLSATWDQTTLISKIVHAMLLLVQGRGLSGIYNSEEMHQVTQKLCTTYENIWITSSQPQVDSLQKNVFKNSYFCGSNKTKYEILDILMYAPFEDFLSTSSLVSDYLTSNSTVTLDEQAYFLRIVFER